MPKEFTLWSAKGKHLVDFSWESAPNVLATLMTPKGYVRKADRASYWNGVYCTRKS